MLKEIATFFTNVIIFLIFPKINNKENIFYKNKDVSYERKILKGKQRK